MRLKSGGRSKRKSIFTKISFSTIILIILCSVVTSAFMLFYFTSNFKEKDELLVREAAKRIESFMLDKYNMMYNQRILMHSTEHIAKVVSSTRARPPDIYQPANLGKITNYLIALCYSDSSILDVILFTADGENAFSYSNAGGRTISLTHDYNSLPYIEAFRASTEEALTAVYDANPPYLPGSASKNRDVITFIGKLYDMSKPTKKIVTGYLMINFSPEEISATYNEIASASDGEYIVVSGNSVVIYSNNPDYINREYKEGFFQNEKIIFNNTISLSGLSVVSAVSGDILLKSVRDVIWRVIVVTGLSILCLAVIIVTLHKYYKGRFGQLASAMFLISQGDFDTRLPVASDDEIGYLSQTFNTMCETLDTYIKRTYLAQTQMRTAELYALQAQINPHFLANTLESIRMRALKDNDYEVSEMLSNLGNLFRWMTQFNQDIVYLEDEMEYIESYLNLQKFRFGDRLRVFMDIPSDMLYLGIPKFTVQPIVENVLTHGFPQDNQPLEISVSFEVNGSTAILTVADNGIGIPKAALGNLKEHISGIRPDPAYGVALQNVHTRIQLLFGKQYGLNIDSLRHKGTTVVVTLPILGKKEMEKYV